MALTTHTLIALCPAVYRAGIIEMLKDPRFVSAPASNKHHHTYSGGLEAHTLEVANYALAAAPSHADQAVLITAALVHDFAKIYDYEQVSGVWQNAPYRNIIRHVSGSHAEFVKRFGGLAPLPLQHQVEHCILAHHGRQEWGSPVEPQTLEALLLHQADMVSAGYGERKER